VKVRERLLCGSLRGLLLTQELLSSIDPANRPLIFLNDARHTDPSFLVRDEKPVMFTPNSTLVTLELQAGRADSGLDKKISPRQIEPEVAGS
jgi:hypothetical protein